ncbi:predicted protein [Sclerotinia sclerotiorum 1980 UF-70]|uniref:Uncharacterized protein n=1 Tax=Sclerotinia sclerotiorum (strain ATCC 18683 / 1980 / Ss-1) TaxID=665079 RepID=A7EG66_SCLS1|nr:predicted protein [Sclerotinia sclerotiorum 1980 UF-70]EDO01832.1 predicted protein [Sclerotinia sclerotiorum 1980 UF-70]
MGARKRSFPSPYEATQRASLPDSQLQTAMAYNASAFVLGGEFTSVWPSSN